VEPYPDEVLSVEDGFAAPEARYERRESLELAFVAALQHLPARQRAVLILREVLGFSAREVADSLETTVPSVNSALQRARKTVEERVPEPSQQATMRALGEDRVREIAGRYMDAWERDDVQAVVQMLTADAIWSMPPERIWYQGQDAIVDFLTEFPGKVTWRRLLARANGQPAIGSYVWDAEKGLFKARVLDVLTLRGDRIQQVTAFLTPEIFPSFGLPEALPAR
jgi:RNA polymerase sigma-70 factor (ECF subfamily)